MEKRSIRTFQNLVYSPVLLLGMLVVILLEGISLKTVDNSFHLYFLDVGQGDSMLIRTPGNTYILIDGGEGEQVLEELGEVLPYWERTIDVVIATHADSDHIGGLVGVLDHYNVSAFVTSDLNADDSYLHMIRERASVKNIPLLEMKVENSIQVGDILLEVLWPEEGFRPENDNQYSLVLQGTFHDFRFVLTGDIEAEQERAIVENASVEDSVVLKAAHHGSKTASSEAFLEAVGPEFFIISCGKDNKFNHPAEEVLERAMAIDSKIFRTDRHGRLDFVSDGKNVTVFLEK